MLAQQFPSTDPSAARLARRIKAHACELGFALCGITTADPPPHHPEYQRWLASGSAGEMGYLHRQEPKRGDISAVVPGARSMICVALNYSSEDGMPVSANDAGRNLTTENTENSEDPIAKNEVLAQTSNSQFLTPNFSVPSVYSVVKTPILSGELTGVVARYARFDDYHDAMWERLDALLAFVATECPGVNGKAYCDTGPLTERDIAMRAGIGWIGKHTNLISRRLGNWFFLGEIVLDIELPADPPATAHCGTCQRCMPACPTGAITAPYQLDARRCISYLTIELKGSIPVELRPLVGTRIYGCDDCLAVCPWNKFARVASDSAVRPRTDLTAPDLLSLLALDEESFRERFRNSPIRRAKRRGLLRNVCVALGNLGDARAVPALTRAAESDPEPLVREHAQWALEQISARCDPSVATPYCSRASID